MPRRGSRSSSGLTSPSCGASSGSGSVGVITHRVTSPVTPAGRTGPVMDCIHLSFTSAPTSALTADKRSGEEAVGTC